MTKRHKGTLSLVAALAAAIVSSFLMGCEGDDDGDLEVRVENYSAGNVTLVIDGAVVAAIGRRDELHIGVSEGLHTVQLLREDNSLLLEHTMQLGKGQFASYVVRSDESVMTPPYVWRTDMIGDIGI